MERRENGGFFEQDLVLNLGKDGEAEFQKLGIRRVIAKLEGQFLNSHEEGKAMLGNQLRIDGQESLNPANEKRGDAPPNRNRARQQVIFRRK